MIIGDFLKELISPVTDIIDKTIVDKDEARERKVRLAELADRTEERFHEAMLAQVEVNKEEAKHSSIFVAGWRPFVGWTGGVGLAYASIAEPLMRFITKVNGYTGEFPVLDTTMLITVLTGMLGIAGMRSFEKYKGVARTTLAEPIPDPKGA